MSVHGWQPARTVRFSAARLAIINELKAQHRAKPPTAPKLYVPTVPLLPAPKCAGLLPAPGRTSSPYTNPKDKLMIGGVVYAVGERYVMDEIEAALVAQRKALKLGLFKRAEELATKTAAFAIGTSVRIRNGRAGKVLRVLTDGRLVVKVDCPLAYWEYYRQDEIDITLDQEKIKAA